MDIHDFIRWRDRRRSWKTKRREEEAREKIDIVLVMFGLFLVGLLIGHLSK